jgi:hypothetical protein
MTARPLPKFAPVIHITSDEHALASDVTPDNVGEYAPYVDCLMVATGISSSFDTLDPVLVARLASRL